MLLVHGVKGLLSAPTPCYIHGNPSTAISVFVKIIVSNMETKMRRT